MVLLGVDDVEVGGWGEVLSRFRLESHSRWLERRELAFRTMFPIASPEARTAGPRDWICGCAAILDGGDWL